MSEAVFLGHPQHLRAIVRLGVRCWFSLTVAEPCECGHVAALHSEIV